MARFLRTWLVPILALLMLIGVSVAFVPLTQQAETRAETELTQLADRALAHIKEGAHAADPVLAAQEQNLLDKAYAVRRFLEHDDALLASDALKALCEQLGIDRIDVGNLEGALIASSDETRIGHTLTQEEGYRFAGALAGDPQSTFSGAMTANPSMLFACVGRTDIEGLVLLTRDDPYVADVLAKSTPEALIADLAYGMDMLFLSTTKGEDGFFRESGNLCLRRTQDDITLIAARPLGEVFGVRNGALCAFGVALVCIVICGIAAYLLRLEPVIALEENDPALNASDEPAGLLMEESPGIRPRRKRGGMREPEPAAEPAADETLTIQHEQAVEHAPRQAGRGSRKTRAADETKHSEEEPEDPNVEDPFEKIVE